MDAEQTTPDEANKSILAESQRLSESILWDMQTRFFERQGIEAWRQAIVPHYVSSNTFIAKAYAQVVFSFLRDCLAAPGGLDLSQPVYIVELGSGSGRFAFHFYKKLAELLRDSPLQDLSVTQVLTDYAQLNVDFWASHALLKPLAARGALDFARFDATRDDSIELSSGTRLAPGSLKNPLVVIGNYLFDTIPQDAFHIEDGKLYEALISVRTTENVSADDPDILNKIEIAYEYELADVNYYGDPAYNAILAGYRERLYQTTLLFPSVGLDCIQTLRRFTSGAMLLMAGDKGYAREEQLDGNDDPGLVMHGSFSLMVNFHAFEQYVVGQGGEAFSPDHQQTSLNVSAYVLGDFPNGALETRLTYRQSVAQFGPDDFFLLKKGVEHAYFLLSVPQLIAQVRLSGWDANVLIGTLPTLTNLVEKMTAKDKREVADAIERVWDTYFPIGEGKDLAFDLGMLLYAMDYFIEAIIYFNHSITMYGADSGTALNCSLCYYNLRDYERALAWVDDALRQKPDYEIALSMRPLILEAMGK